MHNNSNTDQNITVEGMMNEIYQRGPISCLMALTDDFELNYTGGIYIDKTGRKSFDHVVSIVGWGEENGIPYWQARNHWSSHWGGYFKNSESY